VVLIGNLKRSVRIAQSPARAIAQQHSDDAADKKFAGCAAATDSPFFFQISSAMSLARVSHLIECECSSEEQQKQKIRIDRLF
jgi:hypothetical protein